MIGLVTAQNKSKTKQIDAFVTVDRTEESKMGESLHISKLEPAVQFILNGPGKLGSHNIDRFYEGTVGGCYPAISLTGNETWVHYYKSASKRRPIHYEIYNGMLYIKSDDQKSNIISANVKQHHDKF